MTAEQIINQINFASPTWVFVVPCVLMVLDFATGFLNAAVKHEIKSSIMRTGLAKKAGEIVILVIGELIVYATVIPVKTQIMNFLSIYISLMELISIMENLALLGVPVPGFIVRALHQTQELIDQGKEGDK